MPTVPTDGELLMRFVRQRDEHAFTTLVMRHQASVYGVCHRVLGNSHDAEDAFQATFLVLARKSKRFQTAASVGGWLFRVALRTAKNAQTKKWRSKEEALNVTHSSESEPLAIIQEQELVTTLYEELGKLPEKYRTPIVLCMLEGKSRLEASTELECTIAALKARLARGRQQLRINLTRRGFAFSVALTAACSDVSVADAALSSLCSGTATACTSYMFAAEGCSISPDIVQLSEKGMSAMTLTTYSKLAIASLVLLTTGVGSATLLTLGASTAHGSDDAINIELSPAKQSTQRARSISNFNAIAQQQTPAVQVMVSQSAAASRNAVSERQNIFGFSGNATAKSKVSEQASSKVVQALIEALGDSEQQVTHTAAKTLITIGGGRSEVVAAFSQLAANSNDKKLRYYAVAGLGHIGGKDPVALRSLTTILKQDSDAVFRKAAVEALGRVEMSDELAKTLADALKDTDATVRISVAKVLSRLDPQHSSVFGQTISLPKELNSSTNNGGVDATPDVLSTFSL